MNYQHPTNPLAQPLLLRINEAARLLGLGRSTVYELLYKGELPYVSIGTARRIPFDALTQWIASHTTYHA
jgi:excisionase family DNA binding protein